MFSQFRPLTRNDLLLACKLLVIVLCAYETSAALGLSSPIWAGVTAAIVAGGTPGAATRAGLSRLLCTVIGLAIGLLMHLFFSQPLLLGAASFMASCLFCLSFGLKQEMKMAGVTSLMTTLAIQTPGMEPSILMATYRGTNIFLGGVIGVGLSYVLLPQRAADQLQRHIREHVQHLGHLAADIIESYASNTPQTDRLRQQMKFHEGARELRRTLQKESGLEPTDADLRKHQEAQIQMLEQLTDSTTALLLTVERFHQKPGRILLQPEFTTLAAAIRVSTENWGNDHWQPHLDKLMTSDRTMMTALEQIHPQILTGELGHPDMLRLMDIALWSHRIVFGLNALPVEQAKSPADLE